MGVLVHDGGECLEQDLGQLVHVNSRDGVSGYKPQVDNEIVVTGNNQQLLGHFESRVDSENSRTHFVLHQGSKLALRPISR